MSVDPWPPWPPCITTRSPRFPDRPTVLGRYYYRGEEEKKATFAFDLFLKKREINTSLLPLPSICYRQSIAFRLRAASNSLIRLLNCYCRLVVCHLETFFYKLGTVNIWVIFCKAYGTIKDFLVLIFAFETNLNCNV